MSQAEFKKRLKVLMNKPENQVCSDCPERKPTWASLIVPPPGSAPGSLPIGAFCCLECSGSHRRLGVHISFVRSVNLDSWKEKEVLAMENGGNKKVNAIFEARLSASGARKPTNVADGPTRERFIRDKYERRKYFDPAVLQGYHDDDESSSEEEEEEEARPRRSTRPNLGAPRAPSEAARKRIESRQARISGTSTRPAPPVATAQPARAAAAAEVDLLDFGAFSTETPAPAPVPATPTPQTAAPPVASASPNVDLFAEMTMNSGPTPTPAPTPAKPPTKTNDQILAMFGAPVQSQQPTMNPMMGGMMNPQGNMMMMQQPNSNMMMQNNPMMQQPKMNPMIQQQQAQPNMMNNMMMMPQQLPSNMMGMQQHQQQQKQPNMTTMMMQPQQSHPNGMMGIQQQPSQGMAGMTMQQPVTTTIDGFGFPQAAMGSGPPIARDGPGMMPPNTSNGYQARTTQQAPAKEDPFAQFGVNVFRS